MHTQTVEWPSETRITYERPSLTAAKTTLEVARCRFNHAVTDREISAACYELSAAEQRLMQVIDEARASA